ncbi:MAG: DUF4375 domain-containing protein [Candidatus Lokiarchaeota archaeon]|nr:DUF4375 domain-containing protein [Candidatus Lokiarchaeota archaeon]
MFHSKKIVRKVHLKPLYRNPIFYQNPNELSLPEKNIIFIEKLEREVNNGGFNQFFFNSAGDYSHDILTA